MTFSPVFSRPFPPTFDRRNAAGAWWNLFGAIPNANVVAAYQPKDAANLAASYVNLVTPGTYDAAPGTAPTWDATSGWIFNGSTQYLTTGITPVIDQSYSAIVRFTDATGGPGDWIFGALDSIGAVQYLAFSQWTIRPRLMLLTYMGRLCVSIRC